MLSEYFDLKNKVIIVTGASKGIGEEISNCLSKEKAKVYGFGRNFNKKTYNKNFSKIIIDLNDYKSVKKKVLDVFKLEKKIDVLINCVGISKSDNFDPSFDEIIQTNLNSVFYLSNEVFRYMKKNMSGSIINFSSINSRFGFSNNPGYVSSKGAVSALTRSLAKDYGKHNIRVNAISPGYIKTDMTRKSWSNMKLSNQRLDRNVIKRWGEKKDIVGAIILLCSKSSSFITGSEITIDGGFSINGI